MFTTCIQCRARPAKWTELKNLQNAYCGRLCQVEYHLVSDDIIGLEAADGTQIRITAEQARKMKTVENIVEDLGTEEYIPLPGVSGRTLLQLEAFLQNGTLENGAYDLIELLKAANYLDFEELIYYLMPEWVNSSQLFPGPPELRGLIPDALYFYTGDDFRSLDVDPELIRPFETFISANGYSQWNIRMAAETGHVKVVDRLLQDPHVNPSTQDNQAIRMAAVFGHVKVVDRLLQDPRVNPAAYYNFAIQRAAARGHSAVVDRLLQDPRVDPTARDNAAIQYAAENGHSAVVEILLNDPRVDPAVNVNNAIVDAARNGHLKVVDVLMQDPRVNPDVRFGFPILVATRNGHLQVVRRLLQDPRVTPFEAIFEAARFNHVEIFEFLIQDPRVDIKELENTADPRVRKLYEQYSRKRRRVRGMIQ